jgi:hypothetical protein
MSADLGTQLAYYGDLFAADLDAVTVEDAMSTRIGEGKVKALEPVQRIDDGKRNRRGVLLAAAVFIVVVAVGLALGFALRGTTEDVVVTTTEDVVEIPAPPFESGEEAAGAFFTTLATGDYDAFVALFAPSAPNHFGSASVSEQRLRERFEFAAASPTYDLTLMQCIENPAVELAWTCTVPLTSNEQRVLLSGNDRRVLLGGDAVTDPSGEFALSLSSDRLIQRVSTVRVAGTSQEVFPAMDVAMKGWLQINHRELVIEITKLRSRGDHEDYPLTSSPAELAAQWEAAVAEYAATLEE